MCIRDSPTEAPAEPTDAPVEPTEAPVEPNQLPAEPTEAPVAAVEAPTLDIQPTTEVVDGVAYVSEGTLTMTWQAAGAASYHAEILENGEVRAVMDTESTTSSDINTGMLVPGTVYTLRVTAIPAGGTIDNGAAAEMQFCYPPQAEPTEAPAEPTDVPVEATEVPAEPTEVPAEPAEAPVEATEVPVEPTEAPIIPASAPVLDIHPVTETVDGVAYVAEGSMTMTWSSDNAASYRAEILEGGTVLTRCV